MRPRESCRRRSCAADRSDPAALSLNTRDRCHIPPAGVVLLYLCSRRNPGVWRLKGAGTHPPPPHPPGVFSQAGKRHVRSKGNSSLEQNSSHTGSPRVRQNAGLPRLSQNLGKTVLRRKAAQERSVLRALRSSDTTPRCGAALRGNRPAARIQGALSPFRYLPANP